MIQRRGFQKAVSAVLQPERILVLGASNRRFASGNQVLANLRRAGHTEDVVAVHPSAEMLEGYVTYNKIHDVPEGFDVAFVSLPARFVVGALRELDRAQCKAAVVPSAGFSQAEYQELLQFVATSSIAVHGPNCLGSINLSGGVPLWSSGSAELLNGDAGNVALITQSGSSVYLIRAAEDARFSKILSTGNEIDLRTSDYLHWLASDPQTSTIGVIIESIPNVGDFVDAVGALRDSGKALVVLKIGRSARGVMAATAHTGAMLGRSELYEALFDSLDVPTVRDYDELAVALDCLSNPALPRPTGARVAILTESGGEAALSADMAADEGITLAEYAPETTAALRAINSEAGGIDNPLDVGAGADESGDRWKKSYQHVVSDPNVDLVLSVVEAHYSAEPAELMRYNKRVLACLWAAAESAPDKPIVAVAVSSMGTSPVIRERLAPRIPVLRGMRNGLVATRALLSNRRPVLADRDRQFARPAELDRLREDLADAGGLLDAHLSRRLREEYALPMVDSIVTSDLDEAQAWAVGRYPVVVKTAASAIAHRSDIGGVVTDVAGPEELLEAARLVAERAGRARPDIGDTGVIEVQAQIAAGLEAIIGFVSDPTFGPILSVGSGGQLVERLNDVSFARCPISCEDAERLIAGTHLGLVMSGYRNLVPVTSLAPLAEVCSRLSWLASDLGDLFAECDLNPVMIEVGAGNASLVDALFVPASGEGLPDPPS
ncbi:MAG: acetate--CoA ligase family protein [Streptosporangiaceae bacterium]